MDINQTTQMISWLDEEHRRDKAMLVELRQRVESQAAEIVDQAKRVQELEGRLAATQAKLVRFNTLEQALQQVKDELISMIREQDEQSTRHHREQLKNRQMEQESTARSINELKRSLEAIPPLQERLPILKAEDQRLGEVTMSLQTRLTAHERQTSQLPDRIAYVEGQRAQDVKAITQVQEEAVELFRRTETLAGRQEVIEEIARRNEQRISALASYREELTKRQAQLIEDTRLRDAQRERQVQEWQQEIIRFKEEMDKQRKLLERFAHQQETVQQHLVGIDEYKKALNHEQKQVSEHQRLSEERQRRELEEWVAANEQRWTKFRLERDARWNQQVSRHEATENQLKQLESWRHMDLERVQKIGKLLTVMQNEYRTKLRELWAMQERAAVFQLDQVRRWYDEVTAAVSDKGGD